MSFGCFLGIGDSYHPLPWRAPAYTSSDTAAWDDPAYGRRINDYYGV